MGKIHIGILALVIIIIFFSNILPIASVEKQQAGTVHYGFFNSHQEDYFQYVTLVRQGREDRSILFINQYDVFKDRKYIIQPIYNIVGLVTSFLPADSFQIYFLFRITSLLFLFLMILCFLNKIDTGARFHFITLFFFGTTTAIYTITDCKGLPCISEPVTYASVYTNAWLRLLVLPPHHYVALGMFMFILLMLPHIKLTAASLIKTSVSFIILSFIHPFIAMQASGITLLFAFSKVIQKKKLTLPIVLHALVSILLILVIALYTSKVTQAPLHQSFSFPSLEYLTEYTKSLAMGIVFFVISIPLLLTFFQLRYGVIIFLWAMFPFIAQLIPGVREYMGVYRLMQSMQHLPLAILGAYAIDRYIRKYKHIGVFVFGVIAAINLYYVIPMFVTQFRYKTHVQHPEYAVAKIVNKTRSIMKHIPENQQYPVVFAGETLSSIIPTLGKYKVPNAIIGNNPRETESLQETRSFFYGMTDAEARLLLKKYNINYIIFGIDTLPFYTSVYVQSPFLKEIYSQDGYSIVQVTDL